MRIKIEYTYSKTEEGDTSIPDGSTTKEMGVAARKEALKLIPEGSELLSVSCWWVGDG
jgi:hypothetical protein